MALQYPPYRPTIHEKWGNDIPSGPYSEVSSKPCRYYNNGQRCYRVEQGYCPFVHDSNLRNEAIDRQRVARQIAFNDRGLVRARQRLQQDYNFDGIAYIQAQIITTNVSIINKNHPSIAKSKVEVQSFYDAEAATKTIDSPVQASDDNSNTEKVQSVVEDIDTIQSSNAEMKIEEDQFAVKATDNIPSSNVATETATDHAVMKETNKTQSPKNDPYSEKDFNGKLNQQCRSFVRGSCRHKNQCRYFHDLEARKKYKQEKKARKKSSKDADDVPENKADNPAAATQSKQEPSSATLEQDSKSQTKNPQVTRTIKKVLMPDHKKYSEAKLSAATKPKEKAQTQPRQSKALMTYSEAPSKSIVPVPAPEAGIYVATPSWDVKYYEAWACKNLSPATAAKYLVYSGRIPIKLFAYNPKTSPTEGATTFHRFQELPFELRAQIYEMALESAVCATRIVREWNHCKKIKDKFYYFGERFTPKTRPPPFLHVNREFAKLAQTKYERTFRTDGFGPRTWFSFSSDNLFMNTGSSGEFSACLKLFDDFERERILYLTLPLRDFIQVNDDILAWNCSRFKGLRTLTLLVGDSVEDSKWSRDKKLRGKIQRFLDNAWKKRSEKEHTPRIPPPVVNIQVIPAMRAKYFGIDGIRWGMGGTLEREMFPRGR